MMFGLLMGLSLTARNQETKMFLSNHDGPLVVRAVFVDNEGVKWFGTSRGLCRYDDLSWTYYTEDDFLAGKQVNALAFEDALSGPELWAATTEGVSVLVLNSEGVSGSTSYTIADGLLNNDVRTIAVDSHQGKFFGSADGITWLHDGMMDSIIFTEYYSSMFSTPVRQMDIRNDSLYIAQEGGIGRLVSGIDGISGASRWASEYGVSPYSGDIHSVLLSGSGKKYFGCELGVETHRGSFAKQNWDLLSADDGLVNEQVIAIREDNNEGIWFGTLGGVSHLENGNWTSYTTQDGLLNDTVYDIGFDLDGAIWFATGAGACRLKNGIFDDFITTIAAGEAVNSQLRVYYEPLYQSLHLVYNNASQAPVSARLYNSSGILLGTWKDLPSLSGKNQAEISLSGLSAGSPGNGIYVIQLIHGSHSETRKFLINY